VEHAIDAYVYTTVQF